MQEFNYADGAITRARTFALPAVTGQSFAGGLAISPDGKTLYVTRVFAQTVSAIDLASGQVTKTVTLPAEPYSCVVSADGRMLVRVAVGRRARSGLHAAVDDSCSQEFNTERAPERAACCRATASACSSPAATASSVWVFDTFSGEAIEQISMSLYPNAPRTATPNSLALSPDGKTLLVSNADNNAVAVVDVSNGGRSIVNGFVPDRLVSDRRDLQPRRQADLRAERQGPDLGRQTDRRRWAGAAAGRGVGAAGARSRHARRLHAQGARAHAVHRRAQDEPRRSRSARRFRALVGGSSPIKHVFYIIRENRTYDSILGDLKQGNGDPTLTLFGAAITPNAHALASQFVLFDNFYVDADVSYDGHAFSTAAYATDVVQKLWQTYYANRGGVYLGEGDRLHAQRVRQPVGAGDRLHLGLRACAPASACAATASSCRTRRSRQPAMSSPPKRYRG